MTKTQEAILEKIKNGTATNEDRAELYTSVLPFIQKVANKFRSALRFSDETSDLKQEAFLALMQAAETWDSSKPGFLTWLNYYLHTCFNEYLGKQRGIGRSAHERERKASHLEAEYEAVNGMKAPAWYISELTGIRPETLEKMRCMQHVSSLDAPTSEDDLTILGKLEASERTEDIAIERVINQQVKRTLWRYVNELEPKLRDLVVLYFYKGMTQKEIAKKYGVSKTLVFQQLQKAVKKMSTAKHLNELGLLLPERTGSKAFKNPGKSSRWGSSTEKVALYLLEHFNEQDKHKERFKKL